MDETHPYNHVISYIINNTKRFESGHGDLEGMLHEVGHFRTIYQRYPSDRDIRRGLLHNQDIATKLRLHFGLPHKDRVTNWRTDWEEVRVGVVTHLTLMRLGLRTTAQEALDNIFSNVSDDARSQRLMTAELTERRGKNLRHARQLQAWLDSMSSKIKKLIGPVEVDKIGGDRAG